MLNIIRAGMYTSVQDGGRHSFRQSGISHCGALDKPALNVANLLVGNDANAAALEITLGSKPCDSSSRSVVRVSGCP